MDRAARWGRLTLLLPFNLTRKRRAVRLEGALHTDLHRPHRVTETPRNAQDGTCITKLDAPPFEGEESVS